MLRNFMRLITRRSTVYTEMVVDSTILHNTHQLENHLGGSNPQNVAEAATWAELAGYDEVNLNVGCPSCRVVDKGSFGAALMRSPTKVRDIVYEMKRRVQIPVTVKCRLGVDNLDSPEFTKQFVETVSQGGCKHFIVHARKAWLQGVDPKKNRSVPPLLYHRVFELQEAFPELHFSLNGGVTTLELAQQLLKGEWKAGDTAEAKDPQIPDADVTNGSQYSGLYGVMIGRAAMNDPCCLAQADKLIYGSRENPESAQCRRSLLLAYIDYLERYEARHRKQKSPFVLLKPVLGVLSGMPGQRHFRQALDTKIRCSCPDEVPAEVLRQAMDVVDSEFPGVLDYPLRLGKNPRYEEINSAVKCELCSSDT
ncbi:dihydrouridine synthase domain-containing protein, putative [Eimeria tenella]|uniref:tRNA-dihydrouridine synthase n=1 Tax=Eimeria tenella TaxID=5802 RepID=U6KYS9_EIMTE|nr:dihydrouridine synthase domain-containing protein, putative [Eimeria tenella]CDJ43121.1 dihydrouridine synthase domain-containing protein, putative [Eimeria tenella]|eukprot:XP_013233871.1 dihydrouridine synthase domain-containing protein, putative [Eimeria tenella]